MTGLDPSEENIGIAKWHAAQDHRTNGIEYLAVSSGRLYVGFVHLDGNRRVFEGKEAV